LTTVTETLTLPDGTAPGGAVVEVYLAGTSGARVEGFVGGVSVVSRYRAQVVAGAWTLSTLQPNASITPTGTVWRRVVTVAGKTVADDFLSVPASGSFRVDQILTTAPGPLGPPGAVATTGGTMTGPLILSADPTLPLGASTKQYADAQAALRVAKTGDTMSGALNFTLAGDPFPWVTVDNTATKRFLFGSGAAAPAVELKLGPSATAVEVNKGNFSVRADTVDTVAPEIHLHSYNGLGASNRAWGVGIDVVGGRPDPAGPTSGLKARDFVIFKYVTGGGVLDGFYGLHRGGTYMPTWGFGNASAANDYLVAVNPDSGEAAMGGLLIKINDAQTGAAFEVNNGATGTATDKLLTVSARGIITGRNSTVGGVVIKADAGNNRVLAWRDNTDANYYGIEYGAAGSLTQCRFRNLSSSTTIWRATYNQMWIDQSVVVGASGTQVGFFGSGGAGKQTGVAQTAAGIYAALVAYGLIS